MATNHEAIPVLNNLIEICKDGENGFHLASEAIQSNPLKVLFENYSQQRRQMAQELQSVVTERGGSAEVTGHLAGALHRGWINIRTAVIQHEDSVIVEECERGEDVAKKAYETALEALSSSDPDRSLIRRQYEAVLQTHDEVRKLEKTHAGKP